MPIMCQIHGPIKEGMDESRRSGHPIDRQVPLVRTKRHVMNIFLIRRKQRYNKAATQRFSRQKPHRIAGHPHPAIHPINPTWRTRHLPPGRQSARSSDADLWRRGFCPFGMRRPRSGSDWQCPCSDTMDGNPGRTEEKYIPDCCNRSSWQSDVWGAKFFGKLSVSTLPGGLGPGKPRLVKDALAAVHFTRSA
jgi:hypothetical protein